MFIKGMHYQVNYQSGVKSGAPGTDRKLMAFNKKAPFRDSVANVFCYFHVINIIK